MGFDADLGDLGGHGVNRTFAALRSSWFSSSSSLSHAHTVSVNPPSGSPDSFSGRNFFNQFRKSGLANSVSLDATCDGTMGIRPSR